MSKIASRFVRAAPVAALLLALGAGLPANAFVAWTDDADAPWSGPGYYAIDDYAGVDGGPYASEQECEATIAHYIRPDAQDNFGCVYFATEKDMFGGSN